MLSLSEKAAHLLACADVKRPELASVQTAEELVVSLTAPPRPRFRFEYERKAQVLDFLRAHYGAWRNFNTKEADRLAGLTIEQAQGSRALANIPELGKAWWATGDPRYVEAYQRFYLAVPTGEMFNWGEFNGLQGAIELDAYFLMQDSPAFTTEGRIAVLDHLHEITANAWDAHTSRWQQTMLGPEGHNWYLHGMHVLPFFGLLFPEFTRAEFFLKVGMSVVEEHVRGHLKADGGARETTMGYQNFSMCNLWDLYVVAQRNGYPVSSQFVERILNGTKFLLRLMSPVGGMPSFGDGGHGAGQLTQLAAIAAALTGDGECKWYAEYCRQHLQNVKTETPGELPLCAFFDVGLAGAATYANTRAHNPHHTSVLMGPTGYAALRNGETPQANYLAIAAADRGPIVTSHGHNDIFSLDVHAGGTRFIGEMGCAPYGKAPGRQYDEKTEAHSCLTIRGVEQTPLVDEWRWVGGHATIPAVRRWISEDTHDFFHGVHEGYYQYPDRTTLHARKIFFVKSAPSYWVVLDWLESNVENDYRAYFHGCVPGTLDGATVTLGEDGGTRLAIVPPAGDNLTARHITDAGLSAYIEERKLDPANYPCFAYDTRSANDCLAWTLAPLAPGAAAPTITRLPVAVNGIAEDAHGAVALQIAFPDHTDLLCVSHQDFDGTLEFAGIKTWGFLSFRRIIDGQVVLSIDHTMADGVCGR
ncbi:MAG: alginate lyase family protein [Armatimonadota bacterium]